MAAPANPGLNATIIWKGKHKRPWIRAMATGLSTRGVAARTYWWTRVPRSNPSVWQRVLSGVVITWGWRLGQRYRRLGCPVLVMERAPVGGEDNWVSLGWNGLNGRASFPQVNDDGARWREHFGHLVKPWREGGDYVLLIGQVRGDTALAGVDIDAWYREATHKLCWRFRGMPVVFRPHPRDLKATVEGVEILEGDLETALRGAALAVTYSSRVGVDAALAGVPVIACDEGSMARPVAAHSLEAPIITPDRTAWMHRLAWCQWSIEEIRSGVAWDCVRRYNHAESSASAL